MHLRAILKLYDSYYSIFRSNRSESFFRSMYTLYAFSILTMIRSFESQYVTTLRCNALKYTLAGSQFQERRPDEPHLQKPTAALGSAFYNAVRMTAEQIVRDGHHQSQLSRNDETDTDSWLGWLLRTKYSQVATQMLNGCGASQYAIQYCLEYYAHCSGPQVRGTQQRCRIMLGGDEKPAKLLGNKCLLFCAIRSGTCSPALLRHCVQNVKIRGYKRRNLERNIDVFVKAM